MANERVHSLTEYWVSSCTIVGKQYHTSFPVLQYILCGSMLKKTEGASCKSHGRTQYEHRAHSNNWRSEDPSYTRRSFLPSDGLEWASNVDSLTVQKRLMNESSVFHFSCMLGLTAHTWRFLRTDGCHRWKASLHKLMSLDH